MLLSRLLQTTRSDGKISSGEADDLIRAARAEPTAEARRALKTLLMSASTFEPGVKAKVSSFVADFVPAADSLTVPVPRADGEFIFNYFRDLVSLLDGTPQNPLSANQVDKVRAEIGHLLTHGRVSEWAAAEKRTQPGAPVGGLQVQFALAALKSMHATEAHRLTGGAADPLVALAAISASIVNDPVSQEILVPPLLARFYDTYVKPTSPGLNLPGGLDRRTDDLQVKAEIRAGVETLVISSNFSPSQGWSLQLIGNEVSINAEPANPAAPVPLESLNIESLYALRDKVGGASPLAVTLYERVSNAGDAAARRRDTFNAEAQSAIASHMRREMDAVYTRPVAPTALDSKLKGADAVNWEFSRGRADRNLDKTDVMRIVGAATHGGPGALDALVGVLSGLDDANDNIEYPLLLGSAIPYLALGVSDPRVAGVFAPTPSKAPTPGASLSLSAIKKVLADAGLKHIRAEVLMFALHQRDVAVANNAILSQFADGKLPVAWGYRDTWVQLKGTHASDGERNTLPSDAVRTREIDFAYPLGPAPVAHAQFTDALLEAGSAGGKIRTLPQLREQAPVPELLRGSVPSPAAGVWATVLNPMTYHGRRIAQLSELLNRVERDGPIQTPAGKVTTNSVLASLPDFMRSHFPRTRIKWIGRVRTDQFDAIRAKKGAFERAVEAQKKLRSATTPAEVDRATDALRRDREVVRAIAAFPFGNFENEIDRYCSFTSGGTEAGSDVDPHLNALGTVHVSSLSAWKDSTDPLPQSEELLSTRRPLAEMYADHSIGGAPRSANAGLPTIATGVSTGAIATRGDDTFYLKDGRVFLGDQQLVPPGNPLLDKVRVIVERGFLVFALDDPESTPYRESLNPPGISPDAERRYRRGTLIYHVESGGWLEPQGTFNMAAFSGYRVSPGTLNGVPPSLVPEGVSYRNEELIRLEVR